MILNLDILIYNLFASLELRLMCSLLTFQVSRINLEQFYETTCRGEIFMYACKINVTAGLVCLCSKAKSWYFRKETGKRSSQSLSANNYKKALYLNNACCIMPGGGLPNKYDGMIVEIVEKHPLKVTNMGVAPANFTP